ncbi:hypothetical protein BDV19DRAFT_392946 [Aspergillus venezuelensis]
MLLTTQCFSCPGAIGQSRDFVVAFGIIVHAATKFRQLPQSLTWVTDAGSKLAASLSSHFAMISPEDRFFADSQSYYGRSANPRTEVHCRVWDWDQLRLITIKGTAKVLRPEEEVEIPVVERFIDHLSPDVHAITLDENGLIT